MFQALSIGCPSDWLGDTSGNTNNLGVDISADLLLPNSGSGWGNYAGPGTASGNAVSGAYTGDYVDDNNGDGWCFDLDSNNECDPGSELEVTETFILSW